MKTGRFILLGVLSNVLPLMFWSGLAVSALAQSETVIIGRVVDAEDRRPIPSAHVALFDTSETHLQTGTVSDTTGHFRLAVSLEGPAVVQVRSMGYESVTRTVRPGGQPERALGEIALPRALLDHEEIVVQGEQVRARSGPDRITYYVDENLRAVTASGTDILKFIPGVQVDLMQNIALEGSQQILLLVDGRERDPDVMNHLNAADIERVEVMKTPPSRYDADVSGVINVVLKEKAEPHLGGHVHLEAPGSTDAMYLFPAYSLQYGTGKVSLFTSYNGDFRYFDVEEASTRTLGVGPEASTRNTVQQVRQKNWSHKFYYGLDYFASEKHALSIYGWINPFSGENDGEVSSRQPGTGTPAMNRQEEDANLATFHSLHYIFTPGRYAGHELSVEAGLHTLRADNRITFSDAATGAVEENATAPWQQTYRFKADYVRPLTERATLNAGGQARHQCIQDAAVSDFSYTSASFAAYGTLDYRFAAYDVQAGVRAERYQYGMSAETENALFALFPNASLRYTLPDASTIKMAYRRSVTYPQLYQLNPRRFFEEPFAFRTGNPNLDPSLVHDVSLEYAAPFGDSFVSAALFYNRINDAIHSLTSIVADGFFETRSYNLGRVHQYGVQFSGNLDLRGRAGIQPYLKLFEVHTSPHAFGRERGIADQRKWTWEAGLSAHVGFGRGFSVSGTFDYASPLRRMQQVEFSSALYFVSVGKTIGQGGKVEVVSGLPLSKAFTYRGSEIDAPDFDSRSEGIIKLSSMPLIFRLVYRFSKGEQRDRIDHDEVSTPQVPGRGF